ncbi:hypothetical protein OG216_19455 [Streptomycetaceae bacterium NBC_01309]
MINVLVTRNGTDHYPAVIDPGRIVDGFVLPYFNLETVRRIADDTQAEAARVGHGSTAGTAHVTVGQVDGEEQAIVQTICWIFLAGGRHDAAVEVVRPNAEGLYAIGGFDWCWYVVDEVMNPRIPAQVRRTARPPFPGQRGA